MPKLKIGATKTRAPSLHEAELNEAAERFGFTQFAQDLDPLRSAASRAAAAGMTLSAINRAVERAFKRGEARREAVPVTAPAPPPAPVEKKRSRKKAAPAKPAGPMISSSFYPEQPCGLDYKDFRVGHTYKDAYHMLIRPQEEGVYRTITQRAVLRQLGKMKRQTYEQYLADCESQRLFEIEQAHGGREGEYAEESGEFDISFDPSEFAPAEPADFIAFNPRRKRTSRRRMSVEEVWHRIGSPRVDLGELATGIRVEAEHGVGPVKAGRIALDHLREFPDYYTRLVKMEERAKRGLAPNPKIVSLGPHAYFAAAGVSMNGRRTSRRPRKRTSRKSRLG